MNLVNELQISAEKDDVLTVLRKARRLASKLCVNEIDDWLSAEQSGYRGDQAIPEYRKITAWLCYDTNGPIPVGWGKIASGIMTYPGNYSVVHPMSTAMHQIMALIDGTNSNQNLYLPFDNRDLPEFRSMLNSLIADQVTFMLKLNISQVRAIADAVKDRVLDWALALEQRGVLGESMTFSEKEKSEAHTIIFNISNSRIEQLNNMGNNQKG